MYLNSIKDKINTNLRDKHFSEILKGGSLSFITKVLAALLGLLTNLVITRYYGAEALGSLSIIISIVTIVSILSLIGTDVSILRFVPPFIKKNNFNEASNIIKKIFLFTFTISIITSTVLYFSSSIILEYIFKKPELYEQALFASALLIFVIFTKLSIATIRSLKRINLFVFINFLPAVINLLIITTITYFFYNISNPIYSYFTTQIIVCFISLYLLKKYIFNFNSCKPITSFKTILNTSFPMFLTAVMQLVILQTDIIMLGSLSTLEQVGIYAIVMKLAILSSFVIQSLNNIVAPKFSELYHNEEHEELLQLSKKTTKLIFFATIPISFILIIIGKFVLSVFGETFILGYTALIMLTIGQLTNAISGPVGYFLNMTGHQKEFNYIVIFSGILNILLNFLLIPKYGINGAAFASMFSMILWNILATIYTYRKFEFTIMYLPFLKKETNEKK